MPTCPSGISWAREALRGKRSSAPAKLLPNFRASTTSGWPNGRAMLKRATLERAPRLNRQRRGLRLPRGSMDWRELPKGDPVFGRRIHLVPRHHLKGAVEARHMYDHAVGAVFFGGMRIGFY